MKGRSKKAEGAVVFYVSGALAIFLLVAANIFAEFSDDQETISSSSLLISMLINFCIVVGGFFVLRFSVGILALQSDIRDKIGAIERNTVDTREALGAVERNTRR